MNFGFLDDADAVFRGDFVEDPAGLTEGVGNGAVEVENSAAVFHGEFFG